MQLRHPNLFFEGRVPLTGATAVQRLVCAHEVLGFQALCPLARGGELPLARQSTEYIQIVNDHATR